jgi:Putative transmembrane protein (PGPGW)
VKQTSAHSKTEAFHSDKASGNKHSGSDDLLNCSRAESASDLSSEIDDPDQDQTSSEDPELKRIKELPKEVGVMLITAGVVGLILPGPGTPAIIAGGLALWPTAFGKLEAWLERRHPGVHRQSMKQIGRFLNDLERRYPYADRD